MTGFTTGESLKIWNWHNDGWNCEEIKQRLNRVRKRGYLSGQDLPSVTSEQVRKLLKHLRITGG